MSGRTDPFTVGKLKRREEEKKRRIERQIRPSAPKDKEWVLKFENLPHLGVILSLKLELSPDECWGFEHDTGKEG